MTSEVQIPKLMNPQQIPCVDHHPLSRKEVEFLLTHARTHRHDAHEVAKVRMRLLMGIRGMTCPEPRSGEIHHKAQELKREFMRHIAPPGNSDILSKLAKEQILDLLATSHSQSTK